MTTQPNKIRKLIMSALAIGAVEIQPGQPYVYLKYYRHIDRYYIGKCERGIVGYPGSPGRAARNQIKAEHAALGKPVEWEMIPLWSPTSATRAACRAMEQVMIRKCRAMYPDKVVNRFPYDRSVCCEVTLRWNPGRLPDLETGMDYAVVPGGRKMRGCYYKRQQPDVNGVCESFYVDKAGVKHPVYHGRSRRKPYNLVVEDKDRRAESGDW